MFADVEQTLFAVLIGKGRMVPAVDFPLADPDLFDVFDQRFVIFSRISVGRFGRGVVRKLVRILQPKVEMGEKRLEELHLVQTSFQSRAFPSGQTVRRIVQMIVRRFDGIGRGRAAREAILRDPLVVSMID